MSRTHPADVCSGDRARRLRVHAPLWAKKNRSPARKIARRVRTIARVACNRDLSYLWSSAELNQNVRIARVRDAFSSLALTPPVPGAVNETFVMQVLRHEMGHALGLTTHSSQPGDVMANFDSPTLSQRDINTIREAYCRSL